MSQRHFNDYDPYLDFWHQPKLLRGIFSIILVSSIVSIFELGLYVFVVRPTARAQVNKLLGQVSEIVKDRYANGTPAPPGFAFAGNVLSQQSAESAIAVLETEQVMEERMIGKINAYSISTFVILIFFLFIVLRAIYLQLKYLGEHIHVVTILGTQFRVSIVTAVLTIIPLMVFQVAFYFYGTMYNYGSTDKLLHVFNNRLRENMGMPPVN